jgi:hypothetical protein
MSDDSGGYHASVPAGDFYVDNRLHLPIPLLSDNSDEATISDESTDDCVEFQITGPDARGECNILLLSREIFDALSASEKATLPRVFHK